MNRVAYVSVPFDGHLSVLLPLWEQDEHSHLFLLCFNDFGADQVRRLPKNASRVTEIMLNEKPCSPNAMMFNDQRAAILTDVLHVFLYEFDPTLVVYDFFCLEAQKVARDRLFVPAICSIPATLQADEVATCSDGRLLPEHMYWIWKHPSPVAVAPVQFMGPRHAPNMGATEAPTYFPDRRVIYVCFGTVVPRYESCKQQLDAFLKELTKTAEQDKTLQFELFNLDCPTKEDNVRVHTTQVDFYAQIITYPPDMVIFHGGGNMYTELLERGIPMLVCPFFGDQFETARRVGHVHSLGQLHQEIQAVLWAQRPAASGALDTPFSDTIAHYFKTGDLLFGQAKARRAIQDAFRGIDFHLERFAPFRTFSKEPHDLPAIADVYNDDGTPIPSPPVTEYDRRRETFARMRTQRTDITDPAHHLVHHCVLLLMLTTSVWRGKIHFILGHTGPATQIELDHIMAHKDSLRDHVLFYDLQGKRIPWPLLRPKKRPSPPENVHYTMAAGRMFEARTKTEYSIQEKKTERRLPVLDTYGIRTGYINHQDMVDHRWWTHQMSLSFFPFNPCDVIVRRCDLRVHYYYWLQEGKEMQYWPWVYLHQFHLDQVYQQPPTAEALRRQKELQDKLEN